MCSSDLAGDAGVAAAVHAAAAAADAVGAVKDELVDNVATAAEVAGISQEELVELASRFRADNMARALRQEIRWLEKGGRYLVPSRGDVSRMCQLYGVEHTRAVFDATYNRLVGEGLRVSPRFPPRYERRGL